MVPLLACGHVSELAVSLRLESNATESQFKQEEEFKGKGQTQPALGRTRLPDEILRESTTGLNKQTETGFGVSRS